MLFNRWGLLVCPLLLIGDLLACILFAPAGRNLLRGWSHLVVGTALVGVVLVFAGILAPLTRMLQSFENQEQSSNELVGPARLANTAAPKASRSDAEAWAGHEEELEQEIALTGLHRPIAEVGRKR